MGGKYRDHTAQEGWTMGEWDDGKFKDARIKVLNESRSCESV
jgi:hypothetical protein